MARPINNKKREIVQQRILESARKVFCEKGYINVTMTDLIKEVRMSRGGFYFYYKSVDEVFHATIRNRKKTNFEKIKHLLEKNPPFFNFLDDYFEKQKERLLHMESSMLRSLYEYLFTHQSKKDIEFIKEQKGNALKTLMLILQLGVKQNVLQSRDIDIIAEHFMYTIEGLNAMAMFQGLSEETINEQFMILKKMLK